jgi:hypothetical protein
MLNIRSGVPGFVRVGPAPECRAVVSLPQIQPSHLISSQISVTRTIQAPPPTPVFHSP